MSRCMHITIVNTMMVVNKRVQQMTMGEADLELRHIIEVGRGYLMEVAPISHNFVEVSRLTSLPKGVCQECQKKYH